MLLQRTWCFRCRWILSKWTEPCSSRRQMIISFTRKKRVDVMDAYMWLVFLTDPNLNVQSTQELTNVDRRNISAVVLFLIAHFLKHNFSTAFFEPFSFALLCLEPPTVSGLHRPSFSSCFTQFHPAQVKLRRTCWSLSFAAFEARIYLRNTALGTTDSDKNATNL